MTWITNVANTASPPLIFSISYGESEMYLNIPYVTQFDTEAQKLGLQGVTIFVSSGDQGAPGGWAIDNNVSFFYNYLRRFHYLPNVLSLTSLLLLFPSRMYAAIFQRYSSFHLWWCMCVFVCMCVYICVYV